LAVEEALRDLQLLPLHRYEHTLLLGRIWQLRHNLTAYDAAYVALAEVLSASLLTRDAALARSTGHGATIELV
jgi:predicted nucleic acid-binding protein